jgi:hypothetical protein
VPLNRKPLNAAGPRKTSILTTTRRTAGRALAGSATMRTMMTGRDVGDAMTTMRKRIDPERDGGATMRRTTGRGAGGKTTRKKTARVRGADVTKTTKKRSGLGRGVGGAMTKTITTRKIVRAAGGGVKRTMTMRRTRGRRRSGRRRNSVGLKQRLC